MPGLSLHDHVLEEGPITGADLTWFAGCLAEGLASVHDVGVLHRDVKPSNVLMEGRTPILIDFGLARVADDPKLTHTGWLLGTPGYLAPEILYGDDATAASDVHSWAATVAYAGTGRAPFGRGPVDGDHGPGPARRARPRPGCPTTCAACSTAALDPDPGRRPDARRDLVPGCARRPPGSSACCRPAAAPAAGGPLHGAALARGRRRPRGPRDAAHRRVAAPGERSPTAPAATSSPSGTTTDEGRPADPPVRDDARARSPALPLGARARRLLLVVAGALARRRGALTALPLAVARRCWSSRAWLLRSGSLAASAAGDRRRLRGRKWYDGVQFLRRRALAPRPRRRRARCCSRCGAPGWPPRPRWSATRSRPAPPVTLFACGLVFAGSLWLGPGGSRVRSPLARVVNPVSATGAAWLLALIAVSRWRLLGYRAERRHGLDAGRRPVALQGVRSGPPPGL